MLLCSSLSPPTAAAPVNGHAALVATAAMPSCATYGQWWVNQQQDGQRQDGWRQDGRR